MSGRPHRWGSPTPRTERGYGPAHDRIRRALLRDEPNCRICAKEGRTTKATHADHIIPRCIGGADDRSNYQPLCTAHALSKTGRRAPWCGTPVVARCKPSGLPTMRGKQKADCRADNRGGAWAGIPKCLIDSAAYRDLSLHARAVLVELVARMNGYNNGSIAVSHREMQAALGCTSRYIVAAVAQLMDHGLLDVTAEGQWKARMARQYRLTFVSTKAAPATNDYLRWTPTTKKSGVAHGETEGVRSVSHGEADRRHPASYGEAARSREPQKSVDPVFLPVSHGAALIGKPYPGAQRSSAQGDGFTPHIPGGPRCCEQCQGPFDLVRADRAFARRFCSETCRKAAEQARAYQRRRAADGPRAAAGAL